VTHRRRNSWSTVWRGGRNVDHGNFDVVSVLVDLQRVGFREPDRPLFQNLSVTISDGDRLGVVGINGTGKSTLLRIIAGRLDPDEGTIHRGRSVRIEFLEQRPHFSDGTVRSAIGEGWESAATLDRLGVKAQLDHDISSLSGGQAKRVALARTLSAPSELLILDEPTNHLDLAGVAWLEKWLLSYQGALIIVSHDRFLLDRLTTRMLELDRGSSYVHEGGYGSYLESRAEREDQAVAAESTRRNLARTELAWLRRGAKARSRKPQARIDAAKRLIEQRAPVAARPTNLELEVAIPRLGDNVIELTHVDVAYGDAPPILRDVNLLIGPGDRWAILGPNGTGKSSLLDLFAKKRLPTSGRVKVGHTVVVGYYDQHGESLDLDARVQDVVAGPNRTAGSPADVALMKRFWFTGNLALARVRELSGGERRRLQLLAVLASQPNVLLLDEPTNDLDLDTLRVLEDFLDGWPGTLIVVSHDRTFLARTIDTALAIGDDGSLAQVPGGLDAWVTHQQGASRKKSAVATAPNPSSSAVTSTENVKVQRQLREIDKLITKLQRQLDKLSADLLATNDHVTLTKLGREFTIVRSELAHAEELWLTIVDEAD
jgi:ATP-binding cassette subfamily F protein uup